MNKEISEINSPRRAELVLRLAAIQRDLRLSYLRFVRLLEEHAVSVGCGWQDTLDERIASCVDLLADVASQIVYEDAEEFTICEKVNG